MALTAKKVYAILKRQISDMEAKLNSPVRYRGTVATADLLPLNPDIGDMYNIESKSVYGEAGMNVAWNGVVWDTMGAPIDMSLYFTKEEAEAVIQRLVAEYFEKNPVKPGATTEQAQQIEQNRTDITSLKTETNSLKEDKITKPAEAPTIGKILRVKSVNEDGTFVCEWADDGGSNLDVRIDGKSIVQDGVAEIPISSHDTLGLVYTDNSAGGYTTGLMNQQGRLQVNTASIDDVNKRRLRKEIDCSNFDYTVKAAMCDGKGAAWTAEEQAAARERMGALNTQDMIDVTEIAMDAETLKYIFPSFADYRILEISFLKTYKDATELTGIAWLRISDAVGWSITPSHAYNTFTLDASGKSCRGKSIATNNSQLETDIHGLTVNKEYWNSEFREAPYLLLPNVEQAQYYAECNTIIKVRGIKR